MTVLHTGSTKKFATGWENVFSDRGERTAKPSTKPMAKKKAAGGKKQSTAKTGKRR